SVPMRKTLIAIAAVAALSTPAFAESSNVTQSSAELTAGAATGAVVGVGLANGWFGSGTALRRAAGTTAGAGGGGGGAGRGTVAALDGVVEPCSGFHALFGANHGACVNGQYVGYAPRRVIVR